MRSVSQKKQPIQDQIKLPTSLETLLVMEMAAEEPLGLLNTWFNSSVNADPTQVQPWTAVVGAYSLRN
jgi:hypothetical protein